MSAPSPHSGQPVPAWMAAPPKSRRPSRRTTVLALGIAAFVVGAGMIATDTLRAGWAFGRVVAHLEVLLNPPPDRDTAITVASTPRPRGSLTTATASDAAALASPSVDPATSGAAGESVGPSAAGLASPGASGSADASASAPAGSAPSPGTSASPGASGVPAPSHPAPSLPPPSIRPSPTAPPTPTAAPSRAPVQVSIVKDADAVFAHELTKEWCAVAATQSVLAILGRGDTSDDFQREIAGRIGEWESRRDSQDGGWGPGAIVLALKAYGVTGYEVRAYRTRDDALIDAALAISETQKPVLLLTWRGAHTWVMTGYRADADPAAYADAKLTHAQILDPWYPFISSIWGASHRPGFYQTMAEMTDNYLPWQRPEGSYPDRDGMFIAVVPTTGR